MTFDLTRFELPDELAATAPAPRRDRVRLLIAARSGLTHAHFAELGEFLAPGDLVVVNTSATLPAAVDGHLESGGPVTVHFATRLDDGAWVVEIRPRTNARGPLAGVRGGDQIILPDAVRLTVEQPHPVGQLRLWRSHVAVDTDITVYLAKAGRPIRYDYLARPIPLRQYQTVFARNPGRAGSAEMPSAGRPFTGEVVTDLVARGVALAPIVLHTGVSSPEAGEPPQPEPFEVPPATARLVNSTLAAGGRVVAVGTTATRALETAAGPDAVVRPSSGWTDLVLGPSRPARVVGGLITGWHAPGASHLQLLEAVAGRELVERAYAEALRERYLWHEFGDSCLLLS